MCLYCMHKYLSIFPKVMEAKEQGERALAWLANSSSCTMSTGILSNLSCLTCIFIRQNRVSARHNSAWKCYGLPGGTVDRACWDAMGRRPRTTSYQTGALFGAHPYSLAWPPALMHVPGGN